MGFIRKLKVFLQSIDYPYQDKYHPDTVKKTVLELIPLGQTIEDIAQLLKEYRYFRNREKRVLKVFNTPKYSSLYSDLDVGIINNSFTKQTRHERVVISNTLSKGLFTYNTYQVYSTLEGHSTEIKKNKSFFTLDHSNYKLKTFMTRIELYHRENLLMKYKLDRWGKRYRLKTWLLTDYFIDQDEATFTISKLNLDQQKDMLGKIEIKAFLDFNPSGVALIDVMDDAYYDILILVAIGMLYSMIYTENQRRSA